MKNLPPELLGEIIDHLPPHRERSFRNCSLVAKSWTYPAQRRLFQYVNIWEDHRLRSWLDTISPTNAELLHHIRRLHCRIPDVPGSLYGSGGTVDFFRDYPPSFCQLECLVLFSGCLMRLTQIWTPSAFQNTLSLLCLCGSSVAVGALAALLNYFHNLTRLDLIALTHKADGQRVPPLSRPLQELSVTEFHGRSGEDLLDQLMALRPQCEKVTIGKFWSCPLLAQHIINGVEASIKRLNIKTASGVRTTFPKSCCEGD